MADSGTQATYFWPYDIFGYLLPGIIIWAPLTQFHMSVRSVIEARYNQDSVVDNALLIVVCYITGHLVAAVSSMLLERGCLRLTFGYPVTQMLGEYSKGPFPRRFVMKCTRLYQSRWFSKMKDGFVLGYVYTAAKVLFDFSRRRLDWLPGFVHPMDRSFVSALESHFKAKFDIENSDWTVQRRSHDLYWTIQAYVIETMPATNRMSMHFVELYGFSRNASAAFLVCAFYPTCKEWNMSLCCGIEFPNEAWVLVCFAASFILYFNFTRLIRRQNDLLLRSFVASKGHGAAATVQGPSKYT